MKSKINVGVIFGGRSVENEISVLTAIQTMEAINTEKYDITPIYISKEGRWYTGEALRTSANYKNMSRSIRLAPRYICAQHTATTTSTR
jgi:D-alanine-D-alanine ligase